jgi:hypothetical protein
VSYGEGGLVTLACVTTELQALTVTLAGAGSGTVTSTPAGISCGADCTESFAPGTAVQLHATPATDHFFGGWSGACTGTGDCTVTLDQARTVTATFLAPARLSVEVRNTLPDFTAVYGTNAVGGPGGFWCSQTGRGTRTCAITVAAGVPVTFEAHPDPGDSFESWSGACTHGSRQCTFTPPAGSSALAATFDD